MCLWINIYCKLWLGHHTFRVAHGAYVQHSGWPQVLCINYAILSVSGLDGCVICGRPVELESL